MLRVSVDGEQVAVLPLVAQGSTSECTHTIKLELMSYYDIQIDKIVILAVNSTF